MNALHHVRGFHDSLFFPRDSCVTCDGSTPTCNCASDENCVLTSRTCSQCPTIQCIKNNSSSSSSSINPGVIAGPIVAVLVIASVALFWYLRRKKRRDLARLEELAARARKAEAAGFHLSQPNSPAPSSHGSGSLRGTQLPQPPPSASRRASNRRSPLAAVPADVEYQDENGATIRVYRASRGIINLQEADPFADAQSISTGRTESTQSTNVIPIQWVPPSTSNDTISRALPNPSTSDAARTLDVARQNLFRPGQAPPSRPARSPGLDLRLNPINAQMQAMYDQRSPGSSNKIRDSYLSEMSGAASYLSGNSSDFYSDAPRIMTSKQVQIGRLQQAEMVQFGTPSVGRSQHLMEVLGGNGKMSPSDTVRSDPFNERGGESEYESGRLYPPDHEARTPSSQKTFGSDISGGPGSEISGQASGAPSVRTLTPTSRRYDHDGEEGMSSEPPTSGDGDLRFSMGSLAFNRDSVSTQGTSVYLASKGGSGREYEHPSVPPPSAHPRLYQQPNPAFRPNLDQDHRESMSSYKSAADSFSLLGAFPMIPPPIAGQSYPNHGASLPQSSSVTTLDHATIARPPVAFRAPGSGNGNVSGGPPTRPTTAHSVADSFLGSFPFVPPNMDDLAELPSATIPSTVRPLTTDGNKNGGAGRNTLAMSMASEGLGGFDFSFDRGEKEELPPTPVIPAGLDK